ncbi:intermembrane lipid transfer protein VPS13B-like isoform X3 [Biomphalaria glabrata]|uniref:Intermembrane lipid transfer protein VPS13B-like isoform X3 n=1 Tax=Biomphalaria glabrata TaxID=6526 RepID=A0A9W2Z8G0_BIOGL|nr:intermembrane lipid transfer protein VPS13B-like isoform X3 [Biomphalaria glabrata]
MFKLESYITPLLMGYLDKYVKLRQEDFQLSLWGGDAVLNNLDLRLDELEKVLQLPVMFQSGHIHELRLHVPWTKLGSEPVVITINTVECILKVRDTAYDGVSRSPLKSSQGKSPQAKSKRRSQPTEDLPPGYLQSIVNRIINNVTFIINNLILKFVEDDIVLSVNVKSAECYSVDKEWNSAFVDLTSDDLALRKVVNFADLTVCLDKTNASGHIESYQEPMAYRCAVSCRLVMEYDSVSSKLPSVTRFNVFCDTLNLSLTDTQLPMFIRFIELCIAMYYGSLDFPTSTAGSTTEDSSSVDQTVLDIEPKYDDKLEQTSDQGWASWAWSYVPQILPTEDEDMEGGEEQQGNKGRPSPLILCIGIYIHHGTIVFKLTEKSKDSSELPHRKMHFQPFLRLSIDGVGVEVLLQGLLFCSIQCGLTSLKLTTCGNCICDVADEKIARCNTLLSGGEELSNKIGLNYISNSLFDDVPRDTRHYIVDSDEHRQVYTEQYALQRFGAFWVDNLYSLENNDIRHGASSHSSETDNSDTVFLKEFSTLRFVFGHTHLNVSSTLYHRVSKFIHCATNHQYQPYGSSKQVATTPEERPKPSEDQVKSLEEFIPTTLLHMMFINPTVTILQAEHSYCDVAKKNYKYRQKKRDAKGTEEGHPNPPIPAIVLSTSRFDLQITKPMYPGRLVKLVTAIAGPSSNLLHHCHSHLQVKLFSFQAGLQRAKVDGTVSGTLTILSPCSFALYLRSLVLPKLWMNSSLPVKEWMYEVPNASVNINKASVLMCCRIVSTWLSSMYPQGYDPVLNDSLLDDLFPPSGESSHQSYPLLEIGLSGLEFKSCNSPLVSACVGSLSLLHVFLYSPGIAGKMSVIPILYGPNDTSKICNPELFKQPVLDKSELHCDCITATFQKPKHTGVSEAQALALVDCQGLCFWLDPGLISWFHYCPQPRPGHKTEQIAVTLDLSLAQMTSPLNAVSQASVHSTSSPSHPGISRQQTSTSQPPQGRSSSTTEEKDKEPKEPEKKTLGQTLAQYFPLLRMFHVQMELKPCAIFLPKTGVPNTESSSDILTIVHQARHAGRLSDTLVICLPSITVTSTMTKPMNVIQDVPVRSIQGSLIGEKLPWSVKVSNFCIYSLMSGRSDPLFLVHPVDVMSTLAVTCKYNPPTSEVISTMALCLHVDVGQPKLDITAAQLHLCATVSEMLQNVVSNTIKMTKDCTRQFVPNKDKTLLTPSFSHKKSVSSTQRIESIKSVDVTEHVTTDISEDFSHEGSPLHENIIDDHEEAGVKLTLWLQLMFPRLQFTLYGLCPFTQLESGLSVFMDHFDLSMDSQSVYSKAKVTLGSISIQHAVKSGGTWCWTDPDGIVLSFSHHLPSNLHLATNKTWISEASSLKQALHPENSSSRGDKKHGVLSVTFTRALCKNVKKRLRRANIELPPVNELESPMGLTSDGEYQSCNKLESMEMYYHQYLSEFCVKSEPFDIILRPEVILLITGLLNGMVKGEKKKLVHPPSVKLELPVQSNSNVAESTSVHNLPLIYADLGKIRLFLLKSDHDHTKDMYKASQNVGSEDGSSAWAAHSIDSKNPQDKVSACEETHGAECKPASNICCAMNHDFVVAQINSCLIQPHAENPLPRTAQQKDVFMYAVQAGWTHQPGSVIEDRQYQMDVRGISFSSGVWQELIYEMRQAALRKPSTNSMVQIPALDWNTFLMDSPSHERKEIQLLPFSTPFDFSLVVAPPISYIPQGDESDLNKKAWLICGLSTELNLTSDLDLYISTSQVKLISDIAGQISLCFVPKQDSIAAHPTLPPGITSSPLLVHSSKKEPLLGGGGFDSGVESDLSTLTFDKGAQRLGGLRQISQPVSVRTDEQKLSGLTKDEMGGTTNMLSLSTPLDILVTASRISCSVYTYKILEEKFTLEMPVFTDNQQTDYGPAGALGATRNRKEYNAKDNLEDILSGKPRRSSSSSTDKNDDVDTNNFDPGDDGTFNFMKSHAEDSLKRILPKGSVCIVPFVYLYVTQPHCLVSSHSEKEVKIEGSCYDVLIKGSSDKHITAVDELHTLPDCSDYNVHWMETRPGQVHPYTGIPPSLLTIRFSIQPSVPDTINVQLDRPLRFKLSRLAVEQTIAFIQQVTQMFASVETNKESWEIGNEGTDKEETHSKRQHNTSNGILTKVERVEVSTCQIVLVFEMSDTVGAVVSSEGLDLEVDLTREGTGNTPVSGHLQLKDLVLKTAYQKKWRSLLGPLTVSVDAGLSWIPSPGDLYLPQIFLGIETGVILVSFGQEHLFSLTELVKQLQDMMKNLMTEKKQKVVSSKQSQEAESLTKDFVQDRTHDDLRCGKFQFIDGSECSNLLPNAHEIVFSSGGVDTGENSCMTWCYSHPRVITAMHLIPVPFYLSASSQSLESSSHEETSTVPCVLQYWDEMNERFNDLIRFSLSENEPVTVDLPDPRRANKSMCISARMWRVVLLQFTQGEEEGLTKKSDAAVLPASLAACMCVDSAFLPSIIPTLQVTMSIPATYLQLCHHLDYNGSDTPGKLSLYSMSPDLAEQQVFAVLKIDKLTGTSSYVTGVEAEIKMKVSFVTSLDVLEYGYLKMDTVITPAALSLSLDINNTTSKKQEINCFLLCDKFRVEIGKSTVHTLNMAVLSWSSFNPQGSGSHLIFSHYIVCNNTASALRFGQAGTDENILLYSREMYGYSWRSCTVPQMLHLCMDKPAWKWTEPFSVDKEGSSVHSVTAREQSYVVIIKVTKLSNLQTQITVCGQLVVCNRLSQPISMRVSLGANSSKSKPSGQSQIQHYVIEPGEHLPALTSNEVMVNPVQFRLAGFSTSWSHEIFLSGERMKDNQMVKIPLPDSSAYFHVLCRVFCQHFYGMPQKLIMLTPLYVVRTHLPCPLYIHLNSPKHTQEMKVYSQGREFQLHCTGGDVTHEMAFRLGNDMMLSDPAIKLSTGLISQLTRSQLASVDIEKICEQRMDTIHSSWPYLTEESDNIDIDTMTQRFRLDQSRLASNATFEENLEPQPSIDLNIRLSEYIPGCDTLLVEVTPVFLVHNDTDLDIVIAGTEDRMWCIKSGHTMAPPLQKDKFKLAIKYQDMVSEQKVITMSNESQDYRRYNDEIGKVLFVDGYVHASFQIMFQDTQRCEMIFITLTSDIKHDIRVICVRERFALSNQTGMSLKVKLLALPLNPNPISMSETEAVTVVSHGKTKDAAENDAENGPSCGSSSSGSSHVPHPLLQWTTAVSRSEDSNDHISGSEEQEKTFVCYVSFSAVDKDVGSSSKPWVWSSPVRLVSSKDGHKATTSIPDVYRHPDQSGAEEWTPVTHAVCVVTQLVNGVTYVVVNNDHSPACVVENLCPFGLEFGQMCDKLIGNGAVIQEQVELVSDLPWLPPGGWAHYTPPVVNSDFLTRESIVIPKLHFRAIDVHLHGLPTIGPSDWSSATQITGNMDAFVRLPGFCDLKVMIQHIGMVTHLIVRPVSKAEITAKEIRSRIKDQSDVQQPKSKPSKMKKTGGTYSVEVTSMATELSKDAPSMFKLSNLYTFKKFSEKCNMHKGPQISLSLGLLCRSLTLVIQDELNEDSLSELMCLHLNDFFFACYSDAINFDDSGTKTSYIASAGSLQMDNQQYGAGAYDFPVTFLPQKQKDSEVKSSEPLDMGEVRSMQELHALLKCDSFLQFQLVTFSDSTWKQSVIESVDILMKPFSLYIDDTFVYRLVEELENFAPSKLGGSFREALSQKALHRKLPNVVRLNSYTLCHPIRIKQLTLQPIKMLLSVHASLKLFLASDHTPLNVGKFERSNVYSTLPRLSHVLTMHYASAAIFRAGIVVGSLEILGNPTGLVRSIGTGVSDLVTLPYSGLTRGPGAFLTGLSRGIGSLVRNVSAGMITSVTNFASSVSRNMDRLSFDTSHLARQEENRRNRPVGVSDGLKQGLTGFGLSLLGAVAGLADQPIQTLLSTGSPDDRRSSASSAATGFVAGMSKGLVGVFTKPIGGAAEFVSQTGQGILHGTGLGQLPTRLEKPNVRKRLDLPDGPFKYLVKNFSQLPTPELLLVAPAVTFDLMEAEVKVVLLLTPDVLVVVNCDEDAQLQALSISELDCKVDFVESGGRLVLQWVDQVYRSSALEQTRTSTKDRVAAFIDTQKISDLPTDGPHVTLEHLDLKTQSEEQDLTMPGHIVATVPSSSSLTDTKIPGLHPASISPQYEFELEPYWLDLFVTLFRLAKNRLQGKGFPV